MTIQHVEEVLVSNNSTGTQNVAVGTLALHAATTLQIITQQLDIHSLADKLQLEVNNTASR